MGMENNPDRSDVNEGYFASGIVTAGLTQVEVKVGGSRDPRRQRVLIENVSDTTVYLGPSGVTTTGLTRGVRLDPDLFCVYPIGDVALFVISPIASKELLVQEIG